MSKHGTWIRAVINRMHAMIITYFAMLLRKDESKTSSSIRPIALLSIFTAVVALAFAASMGYRFAKDESPPACAPVIESPPSLREQV